MCLVVFLPGATKSTSQPTAVISSSASAGGKKRSKKRGSKTKSDEDFLNEMPTVIGGLNSDQERINQLLARFSFSDNNNGGGGPTHHPPGAYNLSVGGGGGLGVYHQKGDDLTADLMIENNQPRMMMRNGYNNMDWMPRSQQQQQQQPAMPHPMMMMPGQQNLMTNYFTPNLMMKTTQPPGNYLNTDYASLPPGINLSHNLLEEEDDTVDGMRGQSLNEKLR